MTDKLKCPFCGAELREPDAYWGTVPPKLHCANPHCFDKYDDAEKEIWQALIDGKAAQDALKVVIDELDDLMRPFPDTDTREEILTQFGLTRAILEIKRKITSITKQDNE